jgi:hypothetical protein
MFRRSYRLAMLWLLEGRLFVQNVQKFIPWAKSWLRIFGQNVRKRPGLRSSLLWSGYRKKLYLCWIGTSSRLGIFRTKCPEKSAYGIRRLFFWTKNPPGSVRGTCSQLSWSHGPNVRKGVQICAPLFISAFKVRRDRVGLAAGGEGSTLP